MMFEKLYRGELESVNLFVSTEWTSMPDKPSGIYRLTSTDFRQMCARLAMHPVQPRTGSEIATLLDQQGTGSRWFRLSEAVAEWVKNETPIMQVDGTIA